MEVPVMTQEEEIKFERFINVMAELIIKYRNKVDWDSLPDVKMPELKE